MAWVAVAVAGGTLVGGYLQANAQSDAAQTAADAQTTAATQGTDEQRKRFEAVQSLLKPYVDAGTSSLTGQQNILGLNGPDAQGNAISGIEGSPAFTALTRQGENAILANGSATGNLRGGNTEAALAQFRPALLAQLIDSQYSKLGGITSLGQNSAAMTGNAGMNTGTNIANLLQQAGAAQAGAAIAGGKADANMWGNASGAIGQFAALGGFGKF